jgi:pSer/pThr/pTyr-binding forkhead associated (FHA) protein
MDDDQPSFTRIIEPASAGAAPQPIAAGEHPTLVWRPKLGDEQAFPLAHRTATIGRHAENDIVLAGPTVSARHATVRRESVGVVLEDEGSLNGTFVNGQLVQQHLLEAGDQIQVGPHLLVFVPPAGGGAGTA